MISDDSLRELVNAILLQSVKDYIDCFNFLTKYIWNPDDLFDYLDNNKIENEKAYDNIPFSIDNKIKSAGSALNELREIEYFLQSDWFIFMTSSSLCARSVLDGVRQAALCGSFEKRYGGLMNYKAGKKINRKEKK